jgi:Na+/H+ antiporter NhaD/arsenite permease-like protein
MKRVHLWLFAKREPVLSIAVVLAGLSMLFFPPGKEYLSYIDGKTLSCLYCLMLVVAGFRKMFLFTKLSSYVLRIAHNPRHVSLVLTLLTFFFSMAVTNDVALITFIPFTIVVFSLCKDTRPILFTIILQTVAANVGSSLTPVGNPQNLFIYSHYALPLASFVWDMLAYVLSGGIALLLLLFFIPSHSATFSLQTQEVPSLSKPQLLRYSLLFLISLAAVFNLVPYLLALFVVTIFSEKILLKKVDYSLLLTFIALFIFVGNIARVQAVTNLLTSLLEGREFLIALVSSQLISNVPATLLLSQFTENASELLKGVNAGGCGTLIASMASVISFKIFSHYDAQQTMRYLVWFTLVNIGFVLLFLLVHSIL